MLPLDWQGRRRRRPMRWRAWEDRARLAVTSRFPLVSVVIYIGRGVGGRDRGPYQGPGLVGQVALAWHYAGIRLREMPAESLLTHASLAFRMRGGQTDLQHPASILPQVVARLQREADGERRQQLTASLLALMAEGEWAEMVERLLGTD